MPRTSVLKIRHLATWLRSLQMEVKRACSRAHLKPSTMHQRRHHISSVFRQSAFVLQHDLHESTWWASHVKDRKKLHASQRHNASMPSKKTNWPIQIHVLTNTLAAKPFRTPRNGSHGNDFSASAAPAICLTCTHVPLNRNRLQNQGQHMPGWSQLHKACTFTMSSMSAAVIVVTHAPASMDFHTPRNGSHGNVSGASAAPATCLTCTHVPLNRNRLQNQGQCYDL